MFIKNQLFPSPWDEPKKQIRIKTNSYFHQRTEMWNSIHHSSPKVLKQYLESQNQPLKAFSTRPSTAGASLHTTIRKETSRELLWHRKKEREAVRLI